MTRRRRRGCGSAGDRLVLRVRDRTARATLTVSGHAPLKLVARRARAAIFTVTIRRDGAVSGTAPNGGVLGAHLSGAGLVAAASLAGAPPGAFADPNFARVRLFVDGATCRSPPTRPPMRCSGHGDGSSPSPCHRRYRSLV